MPDETNEQDAPQTPPATPAQPVTTPPVAVVNNAGGSFNQADVDRIVADERRRLQQSDEAKKGRAAQARLAELEESQKSETDKLTDRATRAEAEVTRLQSVAHTALIRADFYARATDAHVPADRIDDAFRLADLGSVEVDDSLKVSGVKDALKKLLDSKPYFLGGNEAGGQKLAPNINSGGAQTRPATKTEAIQQAKQELARNPRYAL